MTSFIPVSSNTSMKYLCAIMCLMTTLDVVIVWVVSQNLCYRIDKLKGF